MTEAFIPVVYVRSGCPYCIKLRLFLLEAGLMDSVTLVEGQTPEEHQQFAEMLAQKTGKASFPTSEIASGKYMSESEDLVAHFSTLSGKDPADMLTYQDYVGNLLPKLQSLYQENRELKRGL